MTATPDTWNAAKFTADSRQMDLDLIARARAIAAARTEEDLRATIAASYPVQANLMATLPADQVWAAATGVMQEMMRQLAHLAEREMNRNDEPPSCFCGWTGPGLESAAHRREHADA